jgi:hypothetical protein
MMTSCLELRWLVFICFICFTCCLLDSSCGVVVRKPCGFVSHVWRGCSEGGGERGVVLPLSLCTDSPFHFLMHSYLRRSCSRFGLMTLSQRRMARRYVTPALNLEIEIIFLRLLPDHSQSWCDALVSCRMESSPPASVSCQSTC